MSEQHTPEPWHYQEESDAYTHIVRGNGHKYIVAAPQGSKSGQEADCRRIVACVNACSGIDTVVLEAMPIGSVDMICEQRDALLAENSRLLEENLRYTANLREEAEKLSQQSGDALDAKRWRKINEIIEGVKASRFENIMWGMGFDPYVDGDETHFQELVVRIDAAIAAAT